MGSIATVRTQIEVTRQQIINQLYEEIALFTHELDRVAASAGNASAGWDCRVYNKMIARKRQLISLLSS